MQITSTNFDNGEAIPEKYSSYGENINPMLTFSEIPLETENLALIVEDPGAPNGMFTHWVLYNMSPGTLQIVEGEMPLSGVSGRNDNGKTGYYGPKPLSGTHRYYFRLFALDNELNFDTEPDGSELRKAMEDHIIDTAEIMGTFESRNT